MFEFKEVRDLVKNSFYCSISTIKEDGTPHISPIGSVFLTSEKEGYFIELFTTSFNGKETKKACILTVNTSLFFWIRSLFKGEFKTAPAARIYITIEDRRKISNIEMARFQKRVRFFKGLKGHTKMWSKANYIRPFKIDEIKPVSIGSMTPNILN